MPRGHVCPPRGVLELKYALVCLTVLMSLASWDLVDSIRGFSDLQPPPKKTENTFVESTGAKKTHTISLRTLKTACE